MAKKFKYQSEDSELFKDVVFLVECTDNEQFYYWKYFHNEPPRGYPKLSWEEETLGKLIQIGELDKRPVNISIRWAKLNGKRVMFYDAVSQVVDHKMVEEWMKHFGSHIKWDNNSRWAHCDSSNFHLSINAITGT
jgi:hypothetical protein